MPRAARPSPTPDALATAQPRRFVAYLRVSTEGQGRSGLGLEAQRQAVATYLAQHGGELLAEFQEVESGRNVNQRPIRTRDQRANGALTHFR